jgi:hypothetical protein
MTMASGDIIGNIIYSTWSPKPWSANRADGTFVGAFASRSDAEMALQSTVGTKGVKWIDDVRQDSLVSVTGRLI